MSGVQVHQRHGRAVGVQGVAHGRKSPVLVAVAVILLVLGEELGGVAEAVQRGGLLPERQREDQPEREKDVAQRLHPSCQTRKRLPTFQAAPDRFINTYSPKDCFGFDPLIVPTYTNACRFALSKPTRETMTE